MRRRCCLKLPVFISISNTVTHLLVVIGASYLNTYKDLSSLNNGLEYISHHFILTAYNLCCQSQVFTNGLLFC